MHYPGAPPGGGITRFITFTLSVDVKQIKNNITGLTSNLNAVFVAALLQLKPTLQTRKKKRSVHQQRSGI